jgi:hypothetical protein
MAGIPRFGHSEEFSYIAYISSDNSSDGEDYILGLLFVGLFVLVFFLIWATVLCLFKCHIKGFLSGAPFTNPNLDDPAAAKLLNRDDDQPTEEDKEWQKRPLRVRIGKLPEKTLADRCRVEVRVSHADSLPFCPPLVFIIAGLLQITFAMLVVTQGVANLQVRFLNFFLHCCRLRHCGLTFLLL